VSGTVEVSTIEVKPSIQSIDHPKYVAQSSPQPPAVSLFFLDCINPSSLALQPVSGSHQVVMSSWDNFDRALEVLIRFVHRPERRKEI
jgi:hypothetical protein